MRKMAVLLLLLAFNPAAADEMTAGDLYSFCNAADEMTLTACRFYILGAVQGIAFGDGAVLGGKGRFVPRTKTLFCIPDDMPQSQMIAVFQRGMQPLVRAYPEDLKLPAISLLGAVMHGAFPCEKPK